MQIHEIKQNISYSYLEPFIDGTYSDVIRKINSLLEKAVAIYCDSESCSNDLEYEITYQGQDYISILFHGMRCPQKAAHPTDLAWDWYAQYEGLSMDYSDKNHKYDFYLADGKIGVLFAVSHAVGDYVIVEIEHAY